MTESDRELLELAARAALGKTSIPEHHKQVIDRGWNPLDSDGDALRLAVKLRMNVLLGAGEAIVVVEGRDGEKYQVRERFWAVDLGEYGGCRRAIVRAAAEIGRTKGGVQ